MRVPPEPQPLRFPDQLTKCHQLPIKVMRPEELIHQCNLEGNLELIRRNFREVVNFDYWNPDVRKAPFWIQGFLPSVYLASLAYMEEFRIAQVSAECCPLEQLMWPCDSGGTLGMDCSLAVGNPAYCSTDEVCRGIASLFAECQMTDPNETWYVQGKFQFLMVLQRRPDGTIRQLKVCRSACEDGFEISCVQKKVWDIVKVVEARGPDGRQLPVIVECTDRRGGGANFFHCAWLPVKLISDFRATMGWEKHDDGWIPPAHVNPKLYVNDQYIPVSMRCYGRTR